MAYRKPTSWGSVKPPAGSQVDWGHPISRSLIGCWLFNECGGLRVKDISGNKADGTLTSFTVNPWEPGKFGTSIKLDGSDDYIAFSSKALTSLTISAWIKPSSAAGGYRGILGIQSSIQLSWMGDGTVKFWPQPASSGKTIPTGVWTHVLYCQNSVTGASSYYINGVPAGTGGYSAMPLTTGQIGRGDGTFDGGLDNIRLYERALNAGEARLLFEQPFVGIVAPVLRFAKPAIPPPTRAWGYVFG